MNVILKYDDLLLLVPSSGDLEDDKYNFEERACFLDVLSEVVAIREISTGETDPHGIFEVVDQIEGFTIPEWYANVERERREAQL